jgi:hypothetical protein
MTLILLSGILSLPWSPLASLPPEVDVPLPLRLGFIAFPAVWGAVPGVAELAAGSPVVDPRPLGTPAPLWACANAPNTITAVARATILDLMAIPFDMTNNNPLRKMRFRSANSRLAGNKRCREFQLASNRSSFSGLAKSIACSADSMRPRRQDAISSWALWCHISASANSRQLSWGRNTAF